MPQETTTTALRRDRRLRLGMTLQDLCDRCAAEGEPVSEGQMSRIERGEYMPRPGLRAVLARILSLDIDLQKVEAQ